MDGSTYEIEEDQLGQICARIFKNPKSKIQEINFDFQTEKSYTRISNFNPNCKIKATQLTWKDSKELGEEFLRILKYFDSKYLEMLKLEPEISREFLDQVCKTEQWKCAKKLEATGNFDTRIDWFMHFEQITVQKMYFLSVEKAVEIVKNFQNRNLPVGSFFKICTEFPIMVDTVLTHFSERFLDSKFEISAFPTKRIFFFHFTTKTIH
ncbi:hypothetical protein B9Z55_018120 [Caenorhabditis nigoni]|uniref:DUF38 domain-containing protein n=1 Tax=Caenorhabditis nigoni TaxID=1611254 RepID=A0A2G5TD77_9PELO|nr:hypothetical protein B9Z55_018120 [Caenorhabditis nigoni]